MEFDWSTLTIDEAKKAASEYVELMHSIEAGN